MDHDDDWGADAAAKISRSSNKVWATSNGANRNDPASGQDYLKRRTAKSKMEDVSAAPVSERRRSPLHQKSFPDDALDHQGHALAVPLIFHRDAGDCIKERVKVVRTKHKEKASKKVKDVTTQHKTPASAAVELPGLDAQEITTLRRSHSYNMPKPPPPETRWTDYAEDHHAKLDRLYSSENPTTYRAEKPSPVASETQEGSASRAKRRLQAEAGTDSNHRREIVEPKERASDEDTPQM
jgi:hypothetical protein